jgi:iron complex outermembrane receptor protein
MGGSIRGITAAMMCAVAVVATAPAQAQMHQFDISAGSLKAALDAFRRQAGRPIIYKSDEIKGAHSAGYRGAASADVALEAILAGSGFAMRSDGSGAFAIVRMSAMGGPATEMPVQDDGSTASGSGGNDDILVTGSRIERAGFNAPTPTTVIGAAELRQGQRPNLQQVLNDSPQFRPSVTPQVSIGNESSGSAPVDLRGLGSGRTLTLINGRRFVGNNNLNYLPLSLVNRVEIVTGGASAAYGSDAVAGVVNLILKDKIEGVTIGGLSGISSRGDGFRYGADITAGTSFADGRGQVMFAAEYVNDASIKDRNSRSNLGSAGIVRLNPTNPADSRLVLVRDVNNGNQASAGLITSGIFAGQLFNEDGTLSTFRNGVSLAANPAATPFPAQVIGGADAVGLYDALAVTTPVERISTFARISYDFGNVRAWADASFGRSRSSYPFVPHIGLPVSYTIQATNPFLSPAIRSALAAAGQTSFTLNKFFDGPFMLNYDGRRTQIEGAVGLDIDLGGSWKASGHYSHGETDWRRRVPSPVIARFNNAVNAVTSNGQAVCAINADAITTNDDPACRPLNLFGRYGASAESLAYIRETQRNDTNNKLDSAAVEVQGDLFSLWGKQPVAIAFGAEARFEEQVSISGTLDRAGAYGALNLYGSPVSGGFNVKEGFGEIAVPLFEAEGTVKVDLNGAARYSDYSRSGGIWSWKGGGTIELFDSLLLRGTRSRDIRAPTITDLFTLQAIGIGPVVDQDNPDARRAANPNYISTPAQVTTYAGGNPNLMPEISHTTTLGATFSPKFMRGFNASVDFYNIKVEGAIATLSASNVTLACRNGNTLACDNITRDANGTITQVRSNVQNLATFETKGFDFEISQVLSLSDLGTTLPGTLRLRALATYIQSYTFDTGLPPVAGATSTRIDSAGDVGSTTGNAIPKWRGVVSLGYQNETFGLDARVRYVDGGAYNHLQSQEYVQSITPGSTAYLVDNHINARIYLDLGAQFKIAERFNLSFNVNNLFDRKPPLSPSAPVYYDAVGRYFSMATRVKF